MTASATEDNQGPTSQPRAAASRHALNPLQRMIQRRLAERNWSYRKIARRAGLPRSTIFVLATTRKLTRPPRPATIEALARGLDLPVSMVRAAAAESTGLHYYDQAWAERQDPVDRDHHLLIGSIDELTPQERRHVAALAKSLCNHAIPEADMPIAPPLTGNGVDSSRTSAANPNVVS